MYNIFKSIFRKTVKYKTYSIINIAGLATALALSSLLFMFAYDEYHVDGFHQNIDRIHRVVSSNDGCAFTEPMLAGALKSAFTEIEEVTRVRHINGGFYKFGDNVYEIKYDMCFDSTAFQIFDFQLIAGNEKEALQNPFSIVLTESTSKKIFGDKNPIGESLLYNNICNFTVTGIIKDLPANSTFSIDAILPFHLLAYLWDGDPNKISNALNIRGNESFHTYIMFNKNVDVGLAEKKITSFIKENKFGNEFKLQAQKNIYFDKNSRDRWVNKGDASMVIILLSIAIGLLVISIINYINLNSAITITNLFNHGMRKLLGAKRKELMTTSIVETLLFFIVSAGLAILVVIVIRKPFQNIIGADYSFSSFLVGRIVFFFIAITLLVAFISGYLPSRYSQKLSLQAIINKKPSNVFYSNPINKSLIVLQFVITIIFIVSALTIGRQVNYIHHQSAGFSDNTLIYVDLYSLNLNQSQAKIFKENLKSNPYIHQVSYSAGLFGDVRRGMTEERNGKKIHYRRIYTDPDYIKTLGYHIIEGRDFSWDFKSDETTKGHIINQAMVKKLELKNPLQDKINNHPIIGVVEDFHYESIHKTILPVAFICDPSESLWVANIKVSSNNLKETIQHIHRTFKTVSPDTPFQYIFADDRIASYYKKETQFSKLSILFSLINIFISCIGLVGLVLFDISRRIKEIGIRKVNGAKISEILGMLNKDFIKWITIAFVIAIPFAWYVMNKWLENFAYKTTLSWWIFALAGVLALGIALLTVSCQSWRAATRNPVEALRYE